ncbi:MULTISPECIES: nuclear transport factor 2 family protein [Arthrobacter]|uniref:Nuclear transport factor 2 family protein n=1 Tax=Arthrobacter terricola TaxID=2547396 RepID=A0A4R5KB59_9MICC|nr:MULTISPECIES: nuclear transport factor 2 family protein [Arthrobacter]MBT8162257.1 nuclear transport factor 2 family protein [Arthrobacter sp. GN70]TDF92266.1 nuclear transport factor 2 family protein [Arthrobacter terricola]
MTVTPEACTPAWAHNAGVLDLQTIQSVPDNLGAVADRLLIQETAARYAVAYDERRLDVIESLLTESSTFSYRFGEGPVHTQTGRVAVLGWLDDVMKSQPDQRRHLLGNVLVERITADEALVLSYTAIYGIEGEVNLVTTGVYIFNMVKRENRWLIEGAVGSGTHSEHRGSMPRFRLVGPDTMRVVWTMNDYVTWEPDSRDYKSVPIAGMYCIRGYGLYEEEYVRTPAGWRISFSRLVRTRIDPLVGTPAPAPYAYPAPDDAWLDA